MHGHVVSVLGTVNEAPGAVVDHGVERVLAGGFASAEGLRNWVGHGLMFGRLLREIGQLWEDHQPDEHRGSRYQMGASVVNLTGTKASVPASRVSRLPGPDGVFSGLLVRERHLQEESAMGTLEGILARRFGRRPWSLG